MVAASTPPPRWVCSSASGASGAKIWFISRARRSLGEELPQHLLQLTLLEHLGDDVAAADELAVDEELRDRRPVRPLRQHLAQARVREDVPGAVVHAGVVQDLDHLV